VKLTVDTNVLVRAIVQDDAEQGKAAARALKTAETLVVPIIVICELVWVLRRVYGFGSSDIGAVIKSLAKTRNVVLNQLSVEAGLAVLLAGGDFADGVIAFEGRQLGGQVFLSFDREAVSLLKEQGEAVELL
jgi:predicted nucleic-acid-binding protein